MTVSCGWEKCFRRLPRIGYKFKIETEASGTWLEPVLQKRWEVIALGATHFWVLRVAPKVAPKFIRCGVSAADFQPGSISLTYMNQVKIWIGQQEKFSGHYYTARHLTLCWEGLRWWFTLVPKMGTSPCGLHGTFWDSWYHKKCIYINRLWWRWRPPSRRPTAFKINQLQATQKKLPPELPPNLFAVKVFFPWRPNAFWGVQPIVPSRYCSDLFLWSNLIQ